ncbi:MAG: SURF1 family protein [Pseudomonadota bacterium]
MPRLPPIPTAIVGLAVAAMIALGLWQLDRRAWKHELIARYTANLSAPAIAFPRYPVGEEYLYRRASAFCTEPVGWQRRGGHGADGRAGYRLIAECRRGGAEGPVLLVALGVAADPGFTPAWKGGQVSGVIVPAPTNESLIGSLFAHQTGPQPLMLVAETPPPGLSANARPDPTEIPDNHLAYAVQWFLFALVAAVIYLLALRRRAGKPGSAPPKD